jgi:glycerol-1-phosphate dehydrogenase [NAD(P)+]
LGAREIKAKYVDRDGLRAELNKLKERWPETRARLQKQLVPVEEAVRRLHTVGAPVKPEDIDLPRKRLRDSIIRAQHIRRRYTILDVGVRTCLLEQWKEDLFGKGGMWETN